MGRRRKFYEKIVSGQSDKNISFDRTRYAQKLLIEILTSTRCTFLL